MGVMWAQCVYAGRRVTGVHVGVSTSTGPYVKIYLLIIPILGKNFAKSTFDMATLTSIPYNTPFVISEGVFSKSGTSVHADQKPPNPIGTGPVFYRCFEMDKNGKKKQTFRWISAEVEVSLQPKNQTT